MTAGKKLAGFILGCALCAGLLAGCGGSAVNTSDNGTKGSGSTETQAENKEEGSGADEVDAGYVFLSGQTEIRVDADMSGVSEQLGEPDKYYEEPSCAAQGIAKIYDWPGFEIETYTEGDKDLIACVVLKDDSVATPEGVDLSMGKDDIIAAYGAEYEESENSMVYEKGGTKLYFILNGDEIASIEYRSPVLN